MYEKKEALKEISKKINLSVDGLENIDPDKPSLIVANHRCMKDIFVTSSALPNACKLIMSSRLMWKQNSPDKLKRRNLIENSLYGIPLEVHGGKERLNVGINMAKVALSQNWPVCIFPEGAYIPENQVNRGRTGASRILFETKEAYNIDPNLVPMAIDYFDNINPDLDNYDFNGEKIKVTVCEPVDYTEYYDKYIKANDKQEAKLALQKPIDIAMKSIAKALNVPYKHEYIEIYKRDTIVLENGSEVKVV